MLTGRLRDCDGLVAFPVEVAVIPTVTVSLVGGAEGGELEDCPPPQAATESPILIKIITEIATDGIEYLVRFDVGMPQKIVRHNMPNIAVKMNETPKDFSSGTPLDIATLGLVTEAEIVNVVANC